MAPTTYYDTKTRALSARAQRDAVLRSIAISGRTTTAPTGKQAVESRHSRRPTAAARPGGSADAGHWHLRGTTQQASAHHHIGSGGGHTSWQCRNCEWRIVRAAAQHPLHNARGLQQCGSRIGNLRGPSRSIQPFV
jgi:hypothetical protein